MKRATTSERQRIFGEFRGRRHPLPEKTTLLDLFEDRAKIGPERTALVFGRRRLSYAELDGKANTLAARLRDAGVAAGEFVPVLLGNSLELPIAFLALMKLGAPFVPVDPDWPEDRIDTLLSQLDSSLTIVATRDAARRRRPATRIVDVDQEQIALGTALDGARPAPEDAIYGFFTSGSTGLPKCAVNIHVGILNRLLYMNRAFRSSPEDVVLQNSRPVFDSSIWQLFWPLINGARVVIPPPTKEFDVRERAQLIGAEGITVTDFVPSVFEVLVKCLRHDDGLLASLRSLRRLLIGGEEMNAQTVYEFKELFPHVAITNTYGPTETSIGVIFYETDEKRLNPIPIGRPIDNVNVAIVDDDMELVPIGDVGEICIGGLCMGGGYRNDRERTELAFVRNPFPEVPGPTLYRTGDLGQFLPDGNIHFLGRRDRQVKIKGMRIELGEIEHALLQCQHVHQAVVLVAETGSERALRAFVVGSDDLDLEALRSEIGRRLPRSMMPARIAILEAMPLTHNGKVDRRALVEAVAHPACTASAGGARATGDRENAIHALFAQALGRESVDVEQSFFCLGGDSLAAVDLIVRVESQTEKTITMEEFVANPSVRQLAAFTARPLHCATTVRDAGGTSGLGLDADVALDNAIDAGGRRAPRPPLDEILVTGASGFLGVHVVGELLRRTGARVHCLVRAGSPATAIAKLRRAAAAYGVELDDSRIEVVLGDLGEARMGLSDRSFAELGDRTDTIVHCGAIVNLLYGYPQLRSVNVLGMQEVLRFAGTGRLKWLLHASTVTVLPLRDDGSRADPVLEEPLPRGSRAPRGGYHQSKWVQERLIGVARARGIPCVTFRIGELMASRFHGAPNPLALSTLLMEACLAIGVYPDSAAAVDYLPVDDAARAMVWLAASAEGLGATHHLVHGTGAPWNLVLEAFRDVGHPLTRVSFAEFRAQLAGRVKRAGTDQRLAAVSLFIDRVPADGWAEAMFLTDTARLSRATSETALADSADASSLLPLLARHAGLHPKSPRRGFGVAEAALGRTSSAAAARSLGARA